LADISKAGIVMSFEHKFVYLINDVYLITDRARPKYEPAELPFNIYKDSIKVSTAYIRWSDDKQTSGHSLQIQELEIVARAKLEDYQVVVLFIDEATSAYHIPAQKRKAMQNMKGYILSNPHVTATFFYEESRITRLIEDFVLNILGPIKELRPNFKVYSTHTEGEWDENNPYIQAKLSAAHEEAVRKAERGYDFHKSVIKESPDPQRPGSRNPCGYSKTTLKDDEIELNEYSTLVTFIFYLYSYGYSDKKIAQLLNEAAIPPPSFDAKGWSDSSIRYILCNVWYIGDLAWFARTSYHNSKKKPIDETYLLKNHHEALIGLNLWNVTQFFRKFKQNKDRMNSPFLLRDITLCEKCNEKLVVKNATPANSTKKYLYYRCPVCKEKINLEDLHHIVLSDFSSRWTRELKYYIDKANKILVTWKKTLSDKILDMSKQLEKLKYSFSMLKPADQYYSDLKESFELQIAALENTKLQYHEAKEKIDYLLHDPMVYELFDRFKEDLKSYSFEEQRSILLLAIQRITINFKKDRQTIIEYRLTPFVELEKLIHSLDEESA
jgi:site-specific DNA recombinase